MLVVAILNFLFYFFIALLFISFGCAIKNRWEKHRFNMSIGHSTQIEAFDLNKRYKKEQFHYYEIDDEII